MYNGPGNIALENANKLKAGWYSRTVLQLSALDKKVPDEERIKAVVEIKKWDRSKKNK